MYSYNFTSIFFKLSDFSENNEGSIVQNRQSEINIARQAYCITFSQAYLRVFVRIVLRKVGSGQGYHKRSANIHASTSFSLSVTGTVVQECSLPVFMLRLRLNLQFTSTTPEPTVHFNHA